MSRLKHTFDLKKRARRQSRFELHSWNGELKAKRNETIKRTGAMGYVAKDRIIFPCRSNKKLVVNPQSGHLNPVRDLYGQAGKMLMLSIGIRAKANTKIIQTKRGTNFFILLGPQSHPGYFKASPLSKA